MSDADKDKGLKQFDALLVKEFDRTISDLLGPSVLGSLYTLFDVTYHVRRGELPIHLDTVFHALEGLFGIKAADTICRMTVRRVCQKLELPFDERRLFSFEGYVNSAKHRLIERARHAAHRTSARIEEICAVRVALICASSGDTLPSLSVWPSPAQGND
jgi:hypothetical protein